MKSFITYLTERKDHIIKRLKNLTDDEKDQVIAFFNKKPNLENKIDWQNRNLTFKDFERVMDTSKTERKKAVKKQGIAGLRKGKDYLELDLPEDSPFSAYVPLHHEASRLIASRKIGGVEGKWCIAANDIRDWKRYVYKGYLIPVMFVDYEEKDKYALMLDGDNLSFDSLWDKVDKNLGFYGWDAQFGPHWKDEIVTSNVALLKKARTILDENEPLHWFEGGVKAGKIKVSNPKYSIGGDDRLIWKDGTWEGGTWEYGTWYGGTWKNGTWKWGIWENGTWRNGTREGGDWYNGTWKNGTWKNGIWEKGTWENGTWEDGKWWGGIWMDGTWEKGIWEKGTWEGGTWKGGHWQHGNWQRGTWEGGTWKIGTWKDGLWRDGTWKDGTWKDGTWQRGTWEGGYDKNGNYHEKGDSPDKW